LIKNDLKGAITDGTKLPEKGFFFFRGLCISQIPIWRLKLVYSKFHNSGIDENS